MAQIKTHKARGPILRSLMMPLAFLGAGAFSLLIAWGLAVAIEKLSEGAVRSRLLSDGITWAEVHADGLRVHLSGTAPNEAERYRIVNLVGAVVESSRIRDDLEVTPARAFEAPRFSLEMLRNDDGIQLIGLVPDAAAKEDILARAQGLTGDGQVSDMIETAAYPPPEGWGPALAFGVTALETLARTKISVDSGRVAITAIAASDAEKRQLETSLADERPEGIEVRIDISAPRPVLTPFTFRFVKDASGAKFDSCSADTEAARRLILAAGREAGVPEGTDCIIGLGVPTPSWAAANVAAIKALSELGAGTITFKDADVTLLAASDTPQDLFDRVVGELETALPDVFSLDAKTEKKVDSSGDGPASLTLSLAAETGKLEVRGRLPDEATRAVVENFAKAEFGGERVFVATRTDPALPAGWSVRVLAAMESLGELAHGSALVRADTVQITGVSGSRNARSRISQILAEKLGQGQPFAVDVRYDEALDPLAALPTPTECLQGVTAVLLKQKVTFTPGSAEIDAAAAGVMDDLAKALKPCPGVRMEVAGHTDSQGSDSGNLALSQARAEAVVIGLQGRGVDISGLVAKGYGESQPIADNAGKDGQEANRRIEFHLLDAPGPASGAPQTQGAAGTQTPDANQTPADDSPSLAPTEKTLAPKARPQSNG